MEDILTGFFKYNYHYIPISLTIQYFNKFQKTIFIKRKAVEFEYEPNSLPQLILLFSLDCCF